MILKLVGLFLLYYGFIRIAGLVTLALILSAFAIKKRISDMDEEKWERYFEELDAKGLLNRGFIICILSLIAASIISYYIFSMFSYHYALNLSLFTFIFGILYTMAKYKKNKNEVMKRLKRVCGSKQRELRAITKIKRA